MKDAVISNLVEWMTPNLFGVYMRYGTGVSNKLEKLIDEIKKVKAYLADVSGQVEQLREMDLERQLKEVDYDVSDAIESSLSLRVAALAKNICFRLLLINQLDEALEWSLHSIKTRKLDPITNRIEAYKDLGTQQTKSKETTKVEPPPPPPPKKFVGFKDEADTLISCLMKESETLDVIAITGMHGIGKTTLASKIYHDNRIREEFPTLLWVDDGAVPSRPNKDLFLDILNQCKNSGSWKADTSDQASCSNCMDSSIGIPNDLSYLPDDMLMLMATVKDSLMKSKYLLILDGLWDTERWERVMHMFPATGKVLITSCYNYVSTKPHVLRFLTQEESWELLQLEVFGELGKCPDTLKSAGERIARECDGSPLAVEAAGNSLVVSSSPEAAKNLTEKWWEAVSENVSMYVADYGAQQRVLKRVELSYYRLSHFLRECFLYLGVFPEGREIRVQTLVRLWMAEGLLPDQELILNMRETADRCLRYLADINLVMVVKRYHDGQIKTCRLHKLMHAFCKYRAHEKDLYQHIKITEDRPISLTPNSRLCIDSDISKFLSRKPMEPSVRSILCFNEEEKVESSRIHKRFKLLRVMECSNVNFTRFPKKLNKLIHLRYISLSCDEISEIPENIATLCYLETLVVDTRASSLLFKANKWRMFKLQHLVTKAAIVLAVPREGEVSKYLRTLTRLAPSCCNKEVFRVAPNLKTLGIRGHLATLAEPRSMIKLNHLENLKLINESAVDCQLNLNCIPRTLGSLTLSGTHLKWECMSKLGMIYCLKTLKLINNAFTGESLTSTRADGFGRLSFLLIDTTDLVSWEASPDCLPSLKHLVLKNCVNLQKVPSSLEKCLDISDVGNIPSVALSPTTATRPPSQIQRDPSHDMNP
ncbi:putative late blight resistance protein homolog R1A-10 [Salvia hispanica]|uniref:putative late blight resistance protein homolog R1A-10 n=1 Tax=Salvia hispanica TaxID=49212 RepID=UPI00200988A5|nr:putative late blight resistance protein homolog R1A-10 [Salvia hispanica]